MVHPRSPAREYRTYNYDAQFFSQISQTFGGWPGNRFSQIEQGRIYALAEILRAKQLGKANDLCTACGGFMNQVRRVVEIYLSVSDTTHLYQADFRHVFPHFPIQKRLKI